MVDDDKVLANLLQQHDVSKDISLEQREKIKRLNENCKQLKRRRKGTDSEK